MPKSYAQIIAALDNLPEAKRKAEEDAKKIRETLPDYEPASQPEEVLFERLQTSAAYFENLSNSSVVPEPLKNELRSYSKAFNTLVSLNEEKRPTEAEYNAAVETLGKLQDFLTREENGSTVHETLHRYHDITANHAGSRSKFINDPTLKYVDDQISEVCKYLEVPYSHEIVADTSKKVRQDREEKMAEDHPEQEVEKSFPVSAVRLGAQLLKMQMSGKDTKLSAFFQKLESKQNELENTVDFQILEKYKGLDDLAEAASFLDMNSGSMAVRYNKPENILTADAFASLGNTAKDFLLALNKYKSTNPEAYRELCAEYENELRNADYSDAQEIIDKLELKEVIPDKQGNEVEVKFQEKKANVWIEEIKAERAFAKPNPETNRMELDADKIAKILVIRDLANAERGNQKNLKNCTLRETQVRTAARILKEDQTFRTFIQTLNNDPAKYRAALNAANSGHGGGLDDMFKAYIKNLPAGQMSNAAPLKRYLPTVIDRIEILQKQAKKKPELRAAAAAETIALRNLARAQRDTKQRLEKTIPTRKTDVLGKETRALLDDKNLTAYLGTRTVQNLLQNGHGGKMLERVREHVYTGQEANNRIGNEAKDVLLESTIAGRLKKIQGLSAKVRSDLVLASPNSQEREEAIRKTKGLVGEYLVHCLPYVNPKAADPWSDNFKMMSTGEVVWSDVENGISKISQNDVFKKITDNLDYDKSRLLLLDMEQLKPEDFMLKQMGLEKKQDDAGLNTGKVNQEGQGPQFGK